MTFSSIGAVAAQAQDYDLVIRNGRVMNPEMIYDAVANVGVQDGRVINLPATNGKNLIWRQ